jgi:hypothetical protein
MFFRQRDITGVEGRIIGRESPVQIRRNCSRVEEMGRDQNGAVWRRGSLWLPSVRWTHSVTVALGERSSFALQTVTRCTWQTGLRG